MVAAYVTDLQDILIVTIVQRTGGRSELMPFLASVINIVIWIIYFKKL